MPVDSTIESYPNFVCFRINYMYNMSFPENGFLRSKKVLIKRDRLLKLKGQCPKQNVFLGGMISFSEYRNIFEIDCFVFLIGGYKWPR